MRRIFSFTLGIILLFISAVNTYAQDKNIDITRETIAVGNVKVTVETITSKKNIIVRTSDSEGNTASFNLKDDYIIENGKKIYVETKKEIVNYHQSKSSIATRKKSNWKKIRSFTHTIKFEKAVKNISIAAITAYIKPIYSIGYAIVSEIAGYIKNRYKKGNLKNKKLVYIKTDVYGYIFTTSREGYKRYSLDAGKNKISGTTTYSDSSMKGL